MSTEAEQPVVAAPAQEENGAKNENGAPANGDAKPEANGGAKKKVKEVKPPADPAAEPLRWFIEMFPEGRHKALYLIAKWAVDTAYGSEAEDKPKLPENEQLKRSEFAALFQDGVVFAKLANKLAPGAVESVKTGEEAKSKENQKSNIEGFINFAKAHTQEETVFTVEDVQDKGKSAAGSIFQVLTQLAAAAQDKFHQPGLAINTIVEEVSKVEHFNFLQKIWNAFINLTNSRKAAAANANNAEVANGEEKPAEPGPAVEEKKEEPAAVAAN